MSIPLPPGMARDLAILTGDRMTTGDIAIEVAGKPVYRRHDEIEGKPMDVTAWLAKLTPYETDGPIELQAPFVERT